MNDFQKAGWKLKFPAILLIAIGIIFLLLQVADFITSKSDRLTVDKNQVSIRLDQLLIDIKTYLIIALALLSGYLLLKSKRMGWIIGMPVLLWYLALSINGIYMSVSLGESSLVLILLIVIVLVLGVAISLLQLRSVREKLRVDRKTYLPTLLLLMAIVSMHFLL